MTNYAKYITDRIQSILTQNHPIFEIIILDDCSTDKSVDVLVAGNTVFSAQEPAEAIKRLKEV